MKYNAEYFFLVKNTMQNIVVSDKCTYYIQERVI